MGNSYILKGTENELLLVIRAEDEKAVYNIVDFLATSRNEEIKKVIMIECFIERQRIERLRRRIL